MRLIFLSFFLISCSQFSKKSDRVFVLEKTWVRQSPSHTHLSFRKINRMSALLYNDSIITGNAIDGLVSYRSESGKEIWRKQIVNGVEPSGIIFKDRLYVGGNDGFFYSINASNGETVWSFPTRFENLAAPTLDPEGNLYFLSGSNTLYAVDASSGKQLWLYTRQDTSILSVRGGSKPLYKDGILYVGFSDGSLVAIHAKAGTIKWEKQLNRNKKFRDLDSDPLLVDNKLYVLGFDDQIYCIQPQNGEILWHQEPGGYGSILHQGKYIYYASSNGEMLSLDKENGKKIWSFSLKDGISTAASLYKGLIIFGESQGSLRFLDVHTGKEMGNFNPGRGILSPPQVDSEKSMVYFISNEANMYGLSMKWKNTQDISYLR